MSDESESDRVSPADDASDPSQSPAGLPGGDPGDPAMRGSWHRRPRSRVIAGVVAAVLLVVGVAVVAARGDSESGSVTTAPTSAGAHGPASSSPSTVAERPVPALSTDATPQSGESGSGVQTSPVATADAALRTEPPLTTGPEIAVTAVPGSTTPSAPTPGPSPPALTPSASSVSTTPTTIETISPGPTTTEPSTTPTTIPVVVPVPPSVSAYDFLSANPSVSMFLDLVDDSPAFRALLEQGGSLTVFAPSDDAFRAAGLSAGELSSLVSRHLVRDVGASAAQLGRQSVVVASDGTDLVVDAVGPIVRVDGAGLYAPDNLVNNGDGYVHIVNRVLGSGR